MLSLLQCAVMETLEPRVLMTTVVPTLSTGTGNASGTIGTEVDWNPGVTLTNIQVGDFNGDGKQDLVGVDSSGNWWVGISNGKAGFTTTEWASVTGSENWTNIMVGDFNGDGLADIAGIDSSHTLQVMTSTGKAFTAPAAWTSSGSLANITNIQIGDFNGDHQTDIVGLDNSNNWIVGLSTGNSLSVQTWGNWGYTPTNIVVGDFTGDGKSDIAGQTSSGNWTIGPSTGTSFGHQTWGSAATNFTDVHVADFNGDGKADIVGRTPSSTTFNLLISTGSSFTYANGTSSSALSNISIGDMNGDGKADIVGLESSGWHVLEYNSSGAPGSAFNDQSWLGTGNTSMDVANFDNTTQATISAFQYVYNNIAYDPYAGLLKGSEATDSTKSGNDWDQSALLISKLNALGVSAQYVFGTITPNIGALENWLGSTNLTAIDTILTNAGLVPSPATGTDGLSTYTFKHAWVQAYLAGPSGLGWYNLDPSFKLMTSLDSSINALAAVPYTDFNSNGSVASTGYLGANEAGEELPIDWYEDQVQSYLNTNDPGRSVVDIIGAGQIVEQQFTSLPLQLAVYTANTTFSPTSNLTAYEHSVSIQLTNANTSAVLFNTTIYLDRIGASTVVLDWTGNSTLTPELIITPADTTISANTTSGSGNITLGSSVKLTLTQSDLSPNDTNFTRTTSFATRTAGEVIGIGLDAGQWSNSSLLSLQAKLNADAVSASSNASLDVQYEEELVGYTSMKYFHDVHDGKDEAAALGDAVALHDRIGSGITYAEPVGSNTTYQQFNLNIGDPIFNNLSMDNPGNVSDNYSLVGNTDYTSSIEASILGLMGENDSALEGWELEAVMNRQAISTMQGMEIAHNANVTFYQFTSASTANTTLSNTSLSNLTSSQIQSIVNDITLGYKVIVPARQITYGTGNNTWTGAVWIKTEFGVSSAAAGYMIQSSTDNAEHGGAGVGQPYSGTTFEPFNTPITSFGTTGDPVDPYNGNLLDTETDISIPNTGLPFQLTRTYNTLSTTSETSESPGSAAYSPMAVTLPQVDVGMGLGWTFTYSDFLTVDSNSNVIWTTGDGQRRIFTPNGDGSYTGQPGVNGVLTSQGSGTYTFTEFDGTIYHFVSGLEIGGVSDSNLDYIIDKDGNKLQMTYDTNHQFLQSVWDSAVSSRALTFTWTGNHITQISDFNSRTWTYTYTTIGSGGLAASALIDVKSPTNAQTAQLTTQYAYATSTILFGLLTSITDEVTGAAHQYAYYPDRRVFSVTDPLGNLERYSYDLMHDSTSYTNEDGDTTVYDFNTSGLTTKEITPDLSKTYSTWNTAQDELLSTTDGDGNTQSYTYSQKLPTSTVITSGGYSGYSAGYAFDSNTTSAFAALASTGGYVGIDLGTGNSSAISSVTFMPRSGAQTRMIGGVFQGSNDDSTWTTLAAVGSTAPANDVYTTLVVTDAHTYRYFRYYNAYSYADIAELQFGFVGNVMSSTAKNGAITNYQYAGSDDEVSAKAVQSAPSQTVTAVNVSGGTATASVSSPSFGVGATVQLTIPGYFNGWVTVTAVTSSSFSFAAGFITSNTSTAGTVYQVTLTQFAYDAAGDTTIITDPLGDLTEMTYDSRGRMTSETAPDGSGVAGSYTTYYSYNDAGQVTTKTQSGSTWQSAYDGSGNLSSTTDANGNITTNTYDLLGEQLTTVTPAVTGFASGLTTTYSYQDGNRTLEIDPAGNTTSYGYDLDHRLTRTIEANSAFTQSFYDAIGNVTATRDGDGNTSIYAYDTQNRQIESNSGGSLSYSLVGYDADGDVTAVENALGAISTYAYNALGQKTLEVDGATSAGGAGIATTSYAYDVRGNLVKMVDPDGHTSTYAYDALDRKTLEVDGNGIATTTFAYDKNSNLTKTVDPDGNTTTYGYDVFNHKAWEIDGSGTTTTNYYYDLNGNLVEIIDPRGELTLSSYDALNRVTSTRTLETGFGISNITVSSGVATMTVSAAETYNVGDVLEFNVPSYGGGVVTITSVINSTQFTFNTTLASGTYSGGYVYKRLSLDGTTYTSDSKVASLLVYQNLLGTTVTTTTYGYDALGRKIQEVDCAGSTTTTPATTSYSYDNNNNLTQMVDPDGRTTTYAYDTLNRKTSELDGNGTALTQWGYDANGKLIVKINPNFNVTTYTYDEMGRMTQEVDGGYLTINGAGAYVTAGGMATTIYAYDAAGNLAKVVNPNGNITTYVYDALNRKIQEEITQYDPNFGRKVGLYVVGDANEDGVVNLADLNIVLTNLGLTKTAWTDGNFDGATTIDLVDLDDVLVNLNGPNSIYSSYFYDDDSNLTRMIDPDGTTTTYDYDALGRKIQEVDAAGSTTTTAATTSYAYDEDGNVIQVTDPNLNYTNYAYDALNRQVSTLTREGGKGITSISVSGSTATMTMSVPESYAVGDVISFYIPGYGGATVTIIEVINSTQFTFAAGTLASTSLAGGIAYKQLSLTTYSYDAAGNMTSELVYTNLTGVTANTTSYAYDALNRKTQEIDISYIPGDANEDGAVNLTDLNIVLNNLGVTTSAWTSGNFDGAATVDLTDLNDVYNNLGKTGMGATTTYAYDASGNMTQIIDPDGVTTAYAYDTLNRKTQEVDGSGTATQWYWYDNAGNLDLTEDPDTNFTSYGYDGLNRKILEVDGAGSSVAATSTYFYDNLDNITKIVDPKGNTTTYLYDYLNRKIEEVDGAGSTPATTSYAYDAVGNLIAETNPLGIRTNYVYDSLGRETEEIDSAPRVPLANPTIAYTYDADGNELSVRDANGNTTSYAYDALDRQTKETDQAGNSETYFYDAAGNQTELINYNGRTTTYGYDSLNHQTRESWLSGTRTIETIVTQYTSAGLILSSSDSNVTTAYAYDALDDLTDETDTLAALSFAPVDIHSDYDAAGNRLDNYLALTDSGGSPVYDLVNHYNYDALNRLTNEVQLSAATAYLGGYYTFPEAGYSTFDGAASKQALFTYDADSNLTSQTEENGDTGSLVSTNTYAYDALNRLTGITQAIQNSANTTRSYDYSYNAGSLLTKQTSYDGTASYTYDADNQLLTNSLSSESYLYDLGGNRSSANGTTISTATSSDELTNDGTFTYAYDAEGNLITQTKLDGTQTLSYTWDYRDRLTGVVTKNASNTTLESVSYTYDPENRRISETATGTTNLTEVYVYDGSSLLAVIDPSSGQVTERYFNGQTVDGQNGGGALAEETVSTGSTKWMLTDNVGSVKDVVDNGTGGGGHAILDHIDYDSYGNVLSQSNSGNDTRMGYTGYVQDAATGLDYANARYYQPTTGRFISQDPSGFAGGDTNLYRYVGNDPTTFTDPTGLYAVSGFGTLQSSSYDGSSFSNSYFNDPYVDNFGPGASSSPYSNTQTISLTSESPSGSSLLGNSYNTPYVAPVSSSSSNFDLLNYGSSITGPTAGPVGPVDSEFAWANSLGDSMLLNPPISENNLVDASQSDNMLSPEMTALRNSVMYTPTTQPSAPSAAPPDPTDPRVTGAFKYITSPAGQAEQMSNYSDAVNSDNLSLANNIMDNRFNAYSPIEPTKGAAFGNVGLEFIDYFLLAKDETNAGHFTDAQLAAALGTKGLLTTAASTIISDGALGWLGEAAGATEAVGSAATAKIGINNASNWVVDGGFNVVTAEEAGVATENAAAESEIPAWQQYEQRYGGQQTSMRTTFQGEEVNVRLDNPPTGSQIVDFKDYDWSNPTYQKPFIQQKVIKDFQTQIAKYQTIRPNVQLQFSQQPPSWAIQAIKNAGGTYNVKP